MTHKIVSDGGEMLTRREKIINTMHNVVIDLLVYDRKEDEDLPLGDIQDAIQEDEITVGDIIGEFSDQLINQLGVLFEEMNPPHIWSRQ